MPLSTESKTASRIRLCIDVISHPVSLEEIIEAVKVCEHWNVTKRRKIRLSHSAVQINILLCTNMWSSRGQHPVIQSSNISWSNSCWYMIFLLCSARAWDALSAWLVKGLLFTLFRRSMSPRRSHLPLSGSPTCVLEQMSISAINVPCEVLDSKMPGSVTQRFRKSCKLFEKVCDRIWCGYWFSHFDFPVRLLYSSQSINSAHQIAQKQFPPSSVRDITYPPSYLSPHLTPKVLLQHQLNPLDLH